MEEIEATGSVVASESEPISLNDSFRQVLENAFRGPSLRQAPADLEDPTITYHTDSEGSILSPLRVFDAQEVTRLLRRLVQAPTEQWLRSTKDGLLVLLDNEGNRAHEGVPPYLSLRHCIETVVAVIRSSMSIFPPSDETLSEPLGPIESRVPSAMELEFYEWSIKTLLGLHLISSTPDALLEWDQASRVTVRYLAFRIMVSPISFILSF